MNTIAVSNISVFLGNAFYVFYCKLSLGFNVYLVEKIDTACTVLIKVCEINATLINENGREF